jgi:hypothetical protein
MDIVDIVTTLKGKGEKEEQNKKVRAITKTN